MKILVSLIILCFFLELSYADTVYLKNGRSIKGIVKSEDEQCVELEVGAGSVKFLKSEIANIERSASDEHITLRQEWSDHKAQVQERMEKQNLEEERKPRSVSFSHDLEGIVLDVLLDSKIEARMVLDTGASIMLITRGIADKLRINLNNAVPDMRIQVADGRQVNAKRITIGRVQVQGVEARDVEAAILLDESRNFGFGDGLLGMSFLKKFNFKVDQKNKKLILEKY
jgi:clan AA aspartic protease (TIGR02281 family)